MSQFHKHTQLEPLLDISAEELRRQIDSLNRAALDLHMVDTEQSRTLALRADELVKVTEYRGSKYEQGAAESQALISIYHYNAAQYDEALRLGNEALNTLRNIDTSPLLPVLTGIMGVTLARVGQYSDAVAHFREQLSASIAQGDVANEARAHVGMGLVYGETGRESESPQLFKTALAVYKQLGNLERQTIVYNNLAFTYYLLGQYNKALETALEGLALCDQLAQPPHKAKILNNLGKTYSKLGEYEKSLEAFHQGLDHSAKTNDTFGTMVISIALSQAYIDIQQPDKAISLLNDATQLVESANYKAILSKVHQRLSHAHRMQGNFELALSHFETFFELHSQVFNDTNATKLTALELKYQTEVAERKAHLMADMNVELEQRVVDRTVALEEALQREVDLTKRLTTALTAEERLSKLRAQVITVVSHEFRTPLTTIHTSAELLDRHAARMPEAKKAKYFENIRHSIHYLTALLDDAVLLDVSNSAEFDTTLTTSSCQELVVILTDYVHQHFPESHVEIAHHAHAHATVVTDHSHLSTLLHKLVDNAIRYSDPAARVRVLVRCEIDEIYVSVCDNGIGFSAADAAHLFEPFYRGSNVGVQRGIGLGLHIAFSLARTLGGDLSAESPGIGQGSTFTLRLPRHPDTE